MAFSLKSTGFTASGAIPRKYTCDGINVSPPLEWSGVPAGTKSLLLVCYDPDAPGGTFYHWAAYGIAPNTAGLDEIPAAKLDRRFSQAVNDFGKTGYGGPCPPRGHKPHAYHFRLSALRESLEAPAQVRCPQIIKLARPIEIGETELVGYYGRA